MPQSKWERGFWASVRGGGNDFKPYPPEHWRKPKTDKKRPRKTFKQKITPEAPQLTFFD